MFINIAGVKETLTDSLLGRFETFESQNEEARVGYRTR